MAQMDAMIGFSTVARNDVAGQMRGAAEASEHLPYAEILHHIRANIARRIGVDELAQIARLSVFQLSRAFRREHATTPYRLVLDVRVGHAANLLRAGASIAETALHAGFADQSHLTRHFKRSTGMTPKQFTAVGLARLA